ncbi:hypothetical protein RV07_GL004063 [Enterococcus malodoratus]|nr:hypothetical protein RV07_GL004063 [Enterococcus malodoratus]
MILTGKSVTNWNATAMEERSKAGKIKKTRLRISQPCFTIQVWTAGIEPAPLS